MNEAVTEQSVNTDMAKIIYILYLVGLVTGITTLVGVVMAYVYRDAAPDWLRTHYQFQIRTFWIMLLYAIVAGVLTWVLIGFVLFLVITVWWIVRCVKGLNLLGLRTAYPNPETWGF